MKNKKSIDFKLEPLDSGNIRFTITPPLDFMEDICYPLKPEEIENLIKCVEKYKNEIL